MKFNNNLISTEGLYVNCIWKYSATRLLTVRIKNNLFFSTEDYINSIWKCPDARLL